jgi:fluoride exporter
MLKLTLGVAVGSALGGVLRFWVTHWVARVLPHHLPLGTILVNVAGSFLIGVIAGTITARPLSFGGPLGHQVLMAGLLGGFTTFSAFSLQTLLLAQEGRWGLAVVNVAASVALCLAAVATGWVVGKGL